MKRLLVILLVIVLLLVGAVLILPVFFKDDVVNYVKNEALNAKLEFNEDIELSIISSFPDLTLGIRDVKIINKAPFEGDTLLSFKSFRATIDLWAAIGGDYVVKTVDISQPNVNVKVLKDGTANYDIAPESEGEEATTEETTEEEGGDSYKLKLEHLAIEDANIRYSDSSLATYADVRKMNFSLNGVFDPVNMEINTLLGIDALTVDFDGVKYLDKTKLNFDAGYLIDLEKSVYTIKDNELSLNEVHLGFDGMVAMPSDDIDLDLTFGLKRTGFKDLLSLVPAVFTKDFADVKADGNFEFSGMAKGTYTETSYPVYDVKIGIDNGNFQYPDLPSALNRVDLKTRIYSEKEGELDNMIVDMSKLHFELDQEPFDAKAFVSTPMSDPNIDANIKGKIMLQRVANLIPLEGVTKLAGLVSTNVSLKGAMSAIDEERYEDFDASGFLKMKGIEYAADDLVEDVGISKGKLEFSPSHAALPFFDMTLGKSDLSLQGKITNYLGYVLRDDTLRGEMALASQFFDVNPWVAEDSTETSTQTAEEPTESATDETVVEVPGNIDFVMNSDMKHVLYDSYDIKNFIGGITIRRNVMSFKEIALEMIGGKMVMNGFYDTKDIQHPKSSFSFQMQKVSIPGAYQTFNTVKELMPIASQVEGDLDGRLTYSSELDNEYMPIYPTMNGDGKLSIDKAILNGNKVWDKIVETLKWDEGKKRLVLLNIKPSFGIENGRLTLAPLDFKVGKVACNLSGSNGFDKTLDYSLVTEIPAANLKGAAEGLIKNLAGKELNLPVGETVRVQLAITGTSDDPKVTPKFLGTGGEGLSLKDLAKQELQKKKEEVKKEVVKKSKAELRKQAAKLKEQAAAARKQAAALKKKAADLSAQGEKLKKESNAMKAEADKKKAEVESKMKGVPKVVKEKAMKAADKLYGNASSKMNEANKYFDLAKKPEQEADKLLKKADDYEKRADELLKEE